MPEKIGRNDPCWCGSGKKYKRCCMGSGDITADKADSIFGKGRIMLPLMRVGQCLCNDREELELFEMATRKAGLPLGAGSFKDFLLKSWSLDKIKKMNTWQIIEKLESMNVRFEIEDFKKQAQKYRSAIELAEDHYYTQDYRAYGMDEDFIWMAIIELWNRVIPERYSAEMIDDLMQEGYDDIENDNHSEAVAKWEKAWKMVTGITPPHIKSISDADEIIPQLTQCLYNWCQDFEQELGNAATDANGDAGFFHARRIRYCQEFCRTFPYSDQSIMVNMSRAEAESYAALGDVKKADELFRMLTEMFPANGWGYLGWGDMHCDFFQLGRKPVDYGRAEQIYRLGLAKCGNASDAEVIAERLEDLEERRSAKAQLS